MSACQRENMVIIRSKTLVLAAGEMFRQETLPAVFAGNYIGDRPQPKKKGKIRHVTELIPFTRKSSD
jgi:hypothetical protein